MLTHNSSTSSRIKMLVLLPVFLVAVSCFSKNSNLSAQEFVKKNNTVTYKGNKFTMSEAQYDTIILVDPVTGKEKTQVRVKVAEPIAMNGVKVYNTSELTSPPQRYAKSLSIEQNLLRHLSFDAFPDGIYRIDLANVVIDDKGKVVYYEYDGITGKDKKGNELALPASVVDKLGKDIHSIMKTAPKMRPATLNGKAVVAKSDIYMYEFKIELNNHIATYTETMR